MSDNCGNCNCADKTHCVKKGYAADIIETDKSYIVEMDTLAAAENDGKCKCGPCCSHSCSHSCHGKCGQKCCH